MSDAGSFSVLGQALLRSEDRRLLIGRGRYVGDIEVAGALHVVFVRSLHGHARITGIATDVARAMPGVVAIWTGVDMAKAATTARIAPPIEGLKPVDLPPFPLDRVRFAGDLVAAVVADTVVHAQDAADAVVVDYEPLPAVTSVAAARMPGAASVDDEVPGNHISHQAETIGDVAARFAAADTIVTARFSQHRQTHVPLEPRACIAEWDAGRQHLTFQWGNQASHPMRSAMAGRLRLKEHQITVVSPDVGGAFGQKIAVLREELTCAALSIALDGDAQ
jgi:carbon-monoxide dehydrogenase large subunit